MHIKDILKITSYINYSNDESVQINLMKQNKT
ncbi:hypothetical protein GASC598B02_002570 [Gilliamella apicola SCGC AB-598-B02]|nr:hypothetical protein GASC598B02_002570 [Gilliamella apicola SCGC AB-598-B02]